MAVVMMVSGGVDSFLASALHEDAIHVFVDYGQEYASMERRAVERFWPNYKHVTVSGLPDPGPGYYVPARNLMLATIGSRFGDPVCLAGMRDEMCEDKNPKAFEEMSSLLTAHSKRPVRVFSPFWGHTKSEAVLSYLQAGGDCSLLLQTVSCYGSGDTPCLDCEACFRRFVALRSNGLDVQRPSDSVVRAYGLHRIHSVPLATAHSTLLALHMSGTPVVGVSVEDVVANPDAVSPKGSLRIVYTSRRTVGPDLIGRTLSQSNVRFDAVLTGVPDGFFSFHDGLLS